MVSWKESVLECEGAKARARWSCPASVPHTVRSLLYMELCSPQNSCGHPTPGVMALGGGAFRRGDRGRAL